MWASAPCPICGIEFEGAIHCGKDDLVYVATYGDPQPEGYPMTLERWHELNPDQPALRDDSDDASHVAWQAAKADTEREER